MHHIAVVPGLDLEDDRGLDAFKFELAGYLYGDLLAVGEAFGEGAGVGEGEGGDRVVGEHPLPDVAVSAGLVAFELVELDVDNWRADRRSGLHR